MLNNWMLKGESERKMNKKINSQVLLIDMKEAAYEECIDRLLKLDKNNKHVELTYNLEFLTPFIGVLVASYLNNNTFKVETKIGTIGKKSQGYAKHCNFFHFAENSQNFSERNTNYSGRYTPIMKSILTDYYRGSDNIVESISNKIATVLSCGINDIRSMFEYIIFEMVRNIPEHSHSFNAWHFSQVWRKEQYIEAEFSLIDYGIGFKESLNFKGERFLDSDCEALELALKPGITSGIVEDFKLRENEEKEYLNSGYGLYMITELCKRLQGEYIIISKSAIARNGKVESLTKNKVFPGTAIKIKIRIPNGFTNTAFKDMLKEIADLGEKESRGIRGAIKEASSKSRGLV
ncbi:Uncharacterised protein [Gemella haemolysans]|nr:Uncharacterised protein [Gemella haemolysans]